LQRCILDAGGVAGALLVYARELAVTKDASIGVVTGEIFQQLVEGVLLGLSTGVGRMALLIETSLVDNAKGTPVVTFDIDALNGLWQ
jgi:hypothetical protein